MSRPAASPAALCIWVISSASSRPGGGSSPGSLRASMVFPTPGGPTISRLCPPAAAISSARFASAWPRTSTRSGPPSRHVLGLGVRRGRPSLLLPAQQTGDPVERRSADHLDPAHERGLPGVPGRHDQPGVAALPRPQRRGQRSADAAELAAERQLSAERAALERLGRHLPAGGEQPDGDREVEARARLAHVRGREVDRDAHERELEARVLDRRAHALPRLPDRAVGQAHERERRQPAAYVHLDGDVMAADPLEGEGRDAGEHAGQARRARRTRGHACVTTPRRPRTIALRAPLPGDRHRACHARRTRVSRAPVRFAA